MITKKGTYNLQRERLRSFGDYDICATDISEIPNDSILILLDELLPGKFILVR